jgi:5-methylcytosine-specific restriction endonuclease McrA
MRIMYLGKPSNAPALRTDTAAMIRKHRDNARHRRIIATYRKAHPLCERCLVQGHTSGADEIHHMVPVAEGGQTRDENLLSLCLRCHVLIALAPLPLQVQIKTLSHQLMTK